MTKSCTHSKGHKFDVESVGDSERTVMRLVCKRRGCGAVKWSGCAILRTCEVRVGMTLSMVSGGIDESNARTEIRTQLCATPLFGDGDEIGVCRSCRKGWEVAGNRFASPEEKARAMGSGFVQLVGHGDGPNIRDSDILAMIATDDPGGEIAKLRLRANGANKTGLDVCDRLAAIWNERGTKRGGAS